MKHEKHLHSAFQAHEAGNLAAAEGHYRRFLREYPAHQEANCNLGLLLLSSGRPEEAIPLFQKVARLHPRNTLALVNLGNCHALLRQHALAVDHYRRALEAAPDMELAWYNYGKCLAEMGRHAEAASAYERLLALNPGNARAWTNRGVSLHELRRHEESLACQEKALALAPDMAEALINGSASLLALDRPEEALAKAEQALGLQPDSGPGWAAYAAALNALGRSDEARTAYERVIAAFMPEASGAENSAGLSLLEQGGLKEAQARFEAAIAAQPDFVDAHYHLSMLKTYAPGDPHLAMLEDIGRRQHLLADHARIRYAFALGKALEDVGDYDRAFAAYDEGNRLQHALQPIDETQSNESLQRNLQIFDADFFAARRHWQGAADPRRVPIFIVGMPRSGTTLLEQILGSHPSVFAAGELTTLRELVLAATGASADKPFIEQVSALSEAEIRHIGESYLDRVWRLSPNSTYITDKMPANFVYLGLIRLALPQAKIIHAMRDPMDSCFSCFSRLFSSAAMAFTYDQGTLGRYYVRYITLMRHWHHALPPGSILDLPYEDMVADTEGQARRVLDFIGLPWNPDCLKFHENRRAVKTASFAQVTKPIYKSSVARWKHFARHLQPLLEIVRDFRPADGERAGPPAAPL